MLSNCRNLSVICFRGLFQNVRTKTACLSASRTYVIQNKCDYPNVMPNKCIALSYSNPLKECIRFTSKDKSKGPKRQEYESDSDDEEEEDVSHDEEGRPILKKGGLNSLRLDNILTKIFGLTRRRTEEIIMGNHVYVNGSPAIKGYEIKVNDVIEVKELNPSQTVKNMTSKNLEIKRIKPDHVTKFFEVAYVLW